MYSLLQLQDSVILKLLSLFLVISLKITLTVHLSVIAGFIWGEIKQMWDGGLQDYIHDWWNLMDFVMNSLYLATISLKIVAFVKVTIVYVVVGKA